MYWDWYKHRETFIHNPVIPTDYGGYSPKQLSVARKYQSYKEEILSHLNIKMYNDLVITKAKEYMESQRVKDIVANEMSDIGVFHYDIAKGTSITIGHIISVILYCDLSAYCSSFSGSFRKLWWYETMESVKKRNSEFWFQSKLFRESVEIFGSYGLDSYFSRFEESGPFFSGVNRVMAIHQFLIRLSCPISTSKQMEVSMNFAKRSGIIITLNNDGHSNAYLTSFFDCSWLSRYPDEDERVLCGGLMPIRVQSIRIMETNQNFENIMHALFVFDTMVNGAYWDPDEDDDKSKMRITKTDRINIENLMIKSNTYSTKTVDPYILSIIKAYKRKKKQIIIFMAGLAENVEAKDYGFLFDDKLEVIDIDDYDPTDCKLRSNLISPKIFDILPNITEIVINTNAGWKKAYSFNISNFLDIISKSANWKVVQIQVMAKEINGSWIFKMWRSLSSDLKSKYEKTNLKMEYISEKVTVGDMEYFDEKLMIKRSG